MILRAVVMHSWKRQVPCYSAQHRCSSGGGRFCFHLSKLSAASPLQIEQNIFISRVTSCACNSSQWKLESFAKGDEAPCSLE